MENKEIFGKIIKLEKKQISDNYVIGDLVIEGNAGEGFVSFSLSGEALQYIDLLKIGDEIKVFFKIRGRVYEKDGEKRYFNLLVVTKIVKFIAQDVLNKEEQPEDIVSSNQNNNTNSDTKISDILPF